MRSVYSVAEGRNRCSGSVEKRTECWKTSADNRYANMDCRPQLGLWERDILAARFVSQNHANKSCDDDTLLD
jgi:hypothetical protein